MTPSDSSIQPPADGIRLHIGGEQAREGWSILNVKPGPGVAYVGSCTDLSALGGASCAEIYASHVLEHLGYDGELQRALKECHRVLKPGGRLRVAVPDLEILARLLLDRSLTPQNRFHVMRMMFGGRMDAHDVHYVGLTLEFLEGFLIEAGFREIRRVPEFGLFQDTSSLRFAGQLISLNVEAWK
jgi:predicted SAM-dependent methyltransferase